MEETAHGGGVIKKGEGSGHEKMGSHPAWGSMFLRQMVRSCSVKIHHGGNMLENSFPSVHKFEAATVPAPLD